MGSFLLTANGSPSPDSMTATSRSMWFLRQAAFRDNSLSIRPRDPLAPRWGWDNQVYGWTSDGKKNFLSRRSATHGPCRSLVFTPFQSRVDRPKRCQCRQPARAIFLPTASQIVYSPQSRDFRSEKRYGGGQANSLYIFDLKSYATKQITEGPRPTRDPMWIGDTIYFNSDRDGHFNLYAYDVPSGKTTQVTNNKAVGRSLAQLRQ